MKEERARGRKHRGGKLLRSVMEMSYQERQSVEICRKSYEASLYGSRRHDMDSVQA